MATMRTEAEGRIEDRIIALQDSVDLLLKYMKLFDESQKERLKIAMDYLSDLMILESKGIRETVVEMHKLLLVGDAAMRSEPNEAKE
jgi:hypothetical protein